MIIEFVDINVKPRGVKRWKGLEDNHMRTFQVEYMHSGRYWLQDINIIPHEQFADDPPTYVYCWLCEKFGSVTDVQIIKEY